MLTANIIFTAIWLVAFGAFFNSQVRGNRDFDGLVRPMVFLWGLVLAFNVAICGSQLSGSMFPWHWVASAALAVIPVFMIGTRNLGPYVATIVGGHVIVLALIGFWHLIANFIDYVG